MDRNCFISRSSSADFLPDQVPGVVGRRLGWQKRAVVLVGGDTADDRASVDVRDRRPKQDAMRAPSATVM